ncbi:MAG: hypothetical protein NTV37_08255, partial [Proteobacteria bacterium]|nr:hypothetical protein [Pseudomonadota bacterium]
VCFIDLLGQQEALRGHGALHDFPTKDAFFKAVQPVISPIVNLQRRTRDMVQAYVKPKLDSPRRAALPPELQAEWDEMQETRLSTQYWSDGLIAFVSLGAESVKCPMNGVFGAFGMAGSEMLCGLYSHAPIRGGIEVAWGIELKPGELYGAAIARAYELESKFAQYPRMVVGLETIKYLQTELASTEQDILSVYNRGLAKICLDMVIKDVDGLYILHYLGTTFRENVSTNIHDDLYVKAKSFVEKQYIHFKNKADSKLAFRYRQLLHYFESYAPSSVG